jgi:hypothetical protein
MPSFSLIESNMLMAMLSTAPAVISNAVSDPDSWKSSQFQFITRTCCIAGIIFTTALYHSSFPGRKNNN